MKVVKYSNEFRSNWDSFVANSRNGTFHLFRDFIEYHGDRFVDESLFVVDEAGAWIIAIPLHIERQVAYSHKGLSYGGCIFSREHRIEQNLMAMREVCVYLKEREVEQWYYKSIPSIYHRLPCEDDLFFLFHAKAELVTRNINPLITSSERIPYQERRSRALKKAVKMGVQVLESDALEEYWNIIIELLEGYGSKPVHSLQEIAWLKERFPHELRLFAAFIDQHMVGGILVFESETVAKLQYIAASPEGKATGAIDVLMDHLIKNVYLNKRFIDFGTSTAQGGGQLSFGVSNQKEGFGARTSVHDHYIIELKNVLTRSWEGLIPNTTNTEQ